MTPKPYRRQDPDKEVTVTLTTMQLAKCCLGIVTLLYNDLLDKEDATTIVRTISAACGLTDEDMEAYRDLRLREYRREQN